MRSAGSVSAMSWSEGSGSVCLGQQGRVNKNLRVRLLLLGGVGFTFLGGAVTLKLSTNTFLSIWAHLCDGHEPLLTSISDVGLSRKKY